MAINDQNYKFKSDQAGKKKNSAFDFHDTRPESIPLFILACLSERLCYMQCISNANTRV